MKVPKQTRELVRRRAHGACEYCRLPEHASILPHQVDHIIASQHHGADDADNLCLCCIHCNMKKGPNIASIDPGTNAVVPLFHPRRQSWAEHFFMDGEGRLYGLSPEGRASVQLMDMNDVERAQLRAELLRRGWHL
jgi:hypothetical protein